MRMSGPMTLLQAKCQEGTASHCQGPFDLLTAMVATDGIVCAALWANHQLNSTYIEGISKQNLVP